MTERNSQMKTQRRMGSHHPPASNVSSPLYQRIHQFQALSSLRQQGTDVKKFALRTSVVQQRGWSTTAVLNSSPRAPPLCTFRMLLLSLQTFVLFERKCPAKWTSHDIPPCSKRTYSIHSALKCARREFKLYIFTDVYDVTLVRA